MPKHDTPAKIAAERYRWMVLDWSVLNDCWIVRPWLYSDPPEAEQIARSCKEPTTVLRIEVPPPPKEKRS